MSESHETAVDSREESDPPATSTEPWPGTDRASIQQVAAERLYRISWVLPGWLMRQARWW
jgi:hypothetical protein